MKITENFSTEEFKWNGTSKHFDNLLILCHFGLEPVRKKFGGPVRITSGYRSPERNKAVGGSPTSQHVLCEAVDFVIAGVKMVEVFGFVCNELDFPGQVFFYRKRNHCHIGLPRLKLAPTHKIFEDK
jgi:zinc D-Ala-D-Ala carboxypeptidase